MADFIILPVMLADLRTLHLRFVCTFGCDYALSLVIFRKNFIKMQTSFPWRSEFTLAMIIGDTNFIS